MWEIIGAIVIGPAVAYVADRWNYHRQLSAAAHRGAVASGNRTARQLAEQAVIAANQRELERVVAKLEASMAAGKIRQAAIERGEVNFGDLHKPK